MLKAYAPFNLLLNAAAIEQSRSLDDDSVNVNRYHDHHRQKNNASFKGEDIQVRDQFWNRGRSDVQIQPSSSFDPSIQVRLNKSMSDYPQYDFSSLQNLIMVKTLSDEIKHKSSNVNVNIDQNYSCMRVNARRNKKVNKAKMKSRRIENAADEKMELDILRWYERYQELCQYKEEHGDCLVPQHYESNPQLGMWVSNQRRLKSKVKKTPILLGRIEALNAIGFIWNSKVALKGKKLTRRRIS